MKIAVTGASGAYAQIAIAGLLRQVPPEDIIAISRTPAKLAGLAQRGCMVRQGDFDDGRGLKAALSGAERMLLISTGRVGKRVPQHQSAILAARAAGVRHIVYTSFVGHSPDNPAIVITDHSGTEKVLRDSGLLWTALRDSQYADAMTEAAGPFALQAGVWRSSTGEGRVAFVTREDCAACAAVVLTSSGHENRVYNITGPDRLRFRDVSDLIAEVAGRPIRFEDVSSEEMYAMWDALGVPRSALDDHRVSHFAWSSEDMVTFEAAIRGGYFDVISEDAERLLGRRPESFRSFLERRADALRSIAQAR